MGEIYCAMIATRLACWALLVACGCMLVGASVEVLDDAELSHHSHNHHHGHRHGRHHAHRHGGRGGGHHGHHRAHKGGGKDPIWAQSKVAWLKNHGVKPDEVHHMPSGGPPHSETHELGDTARAELSLAKEMVDNNKGHVVTEYTDSAEDVEALVQLSKDKTSQFPEVNKLEAIKAKKHAHMRKHMGHHHHGRHHHRHHHRHHSRHHSPRHERRDRRDEDRDFGEEGGERDRAQRPNRHGAFRSASAAMAAAGWDNLRLAGQHGHGNFGEEKNNHDMGKSKKKQKKEQKAKDKAKVVEKKEEQKAKDAAKKTTAGAKKQAKKAKKVQKKKLKAKRRSRRSRTHLE